MQLNKETKETNIKLRYLKPFVFKQTSSGSYKYNDTHKLFAYNIYIYIYIYIYI